MDKADISSAEELVGYSFRDKALLERSVTHASLVDVRHESNERLEFLGDAVLGLVVCEYLHEKFPDLLEGDMTKIKSLVVSRNQCADVAEEMGLEHLLRMGKGMVGRGGLPRSVLAAVYESLIGAIYIDGGLEPARQMITNNLKKRIHAAAESGHQSNFKSVLQQLSQRIYELTPQYIVLDEKGPDHAKAFEVAVEIGARRFSSCWGTSKKQAEQEAALAALLELDAAMQDESGVVHLIPESE
jgi:ribonuclease-3